VGNYPPNPWGSLQHEFLEKKVDLPPGAQCVWQTFFFGFGGVELL
jgi:hypothetical protein